jgi:hypothetical protein
MKQINQKQMPPLVGRLKKEVVAAVRKKIKEGNVYLLRVGVFLYLKVWPKPRIKIDNKQKIEKNAVYF